MKIKYYNFQKWIIFSIVVIPMILWSLSTYFDLQAYIKSKAIEQSNLEMDRFSEQIFINLENYLNQLETLEKLELLNRETLEESEITLVTDMDQLPKGRGVYIDEEHQVFTLYINPFTSNSALVQNLNFEYFNALSDSYELLSNGSLNLDLDKLQIINQSYYKAFYNENLDLEFVIKGDVENPHTSIFPIWSIFLIVINFTIFYLFSTILRNKTYPLINLMGTLKDIKEGRYEDQYNKSMGFSQPLDQLIEELVDVEIDLEAQKMALEASCIKYKRDIEEILFRGKSLKKEHDQFFAEMETKEGMNQVLFDAVNEIIFLINSEGIIIEVNHAFESKLGFKKDEIVGKSILSIIMDREKKLEELMISHTEPLFMNFKMGSFDSKIAQFLSIHIEALPNGNYLYIGKSVNEEITLQSRILRKNRELEYINQINSALISNWGLNELLVNIINRIDYLFNIVSGTIRIKNDNGLWELKAKTDKGYFKYESYVEDINAYYGSDIISNSEIKMIEIDDHYREKHCLSDDMKQLLIAPMEDGGEIISILTIVVDHMLTANDINILKMFKNQASVVIQRALLYDQLRKQYFNTIQALVNVIEAKDKYTEGHSRRVSRFSVEIATEMGYSNEELENIEIAGLLHDVGKVGIHHSILMKQGKLSDEEYEIIKEHPEKGIQILKSIKLDDQIMEGILYHHVRYDLKGYPTNHKLEVMPEYAGIIGVADAFDAITSERSYSKAKTIYEGVKELIRNKGTQFTPSIIDAFEKIMKDNPNRLQEIIDDIC